MSLFPVDRYLRAARRRTDLSQRELAERASVPQSTIARIENNAQLVRIDRFAELLACMGLRLAIVDEDGELLAPEGADDASLTDHGGRRYPAHLDVRPGSTGWWGDGWPMFEGKQPAYTFDRKRSTRDWRRAHEESPE